MRWARLASIGVLCLLCFGVSMTRGQSPRAWQAAAQGMHIDADLAKGPGFDWLLNRAQNSRFVLIGEQHGLDGPANLARQLLKELRPHGFNTLALEMGPWVADRVNEVGLEQATKESPFAIAFDSNDDLALMHSVLSDVAGQTGEVWGLDQASNVIHLMQRLVELAPDPSAACAARGLLLKTALRGGEYSRQDHAEEIARLQARFGNPKTGEAARIFSAMEATNEIFLTYRQGAAGEIFPQISVELRENYMQRRFQELLDAATGSPKVLFKMGGAHTMRGVGPNGIPTLGDYVARLATDNGEQALSVSIRAWSAENTTMPEETFGDFTAVLIDTQALREQLTPDELSALPQTLQRDLTGFDAIVYLREAGGLNFSEIAPAKAAFRRDIITNLTYLAAPAVVLVGWLIVFLIGTLFRKRSSNSTTTVRVRGARFAMCLCSLFALGVLGWQLSVLIWSKTDASGLLATGFWDSGWIPALLLSGIIALGLFIAVVSKERGTRWRSLGFCLACISDIALVSLMCYWNLGGMLSSGPG